METATATTTRARHINCRLRSGILRLSSIAIGSSGAPAGNRKRRSADGGYDGQSRPLIGGLRQRYNRCGPESRQTTPFGCVVGIRLAVLRHAWVSCPLWFSLKASKHVGSGSIFAGLTLSQVPSLSSSAERWGKLELATVWESRLSWRASMGSISTPARLGPFPSIPSRHRPNLDTPCHFHRRKYRSGCSRMS